MFQLIRALLNVLVIAAFVFLNSVSAQQQNRAASQSNSSRQSEEGMAPLDESEPAAPVDHGTYVIGAEDHLAIRVWREPEVSGSVIVRPDGMITMPLIGEVQAAGKTPNQLKEAIAEQLSEYLTRPEVLVSVTGIRSKKYYITGQVNSTGSFPLVVPTTILEALSGAGGFQQWANTKKIVILRGNKRIPFNYKDVIKGKNLDQNIYLENGDHIIVP
jgi:polysaccharide export outer membrane protein